MKQIRLGCGLYSLVDDEDYEWLSTMTWGCLPGEYTTYAKWGYRMGKKKGSLLMHRVLLDAKEGEIVDHKNGNGLDNRKDNLRIATIVQHALNKQRRKDRPFKQKGVRKVNDKYRAYVSVNKKQIHLGYYNTPEEAGKVVEEYMTRLHGPDYVPDTR